MFQLWEDRPLVINFFQKTNEFILNNLNKKGLMNAESPEEGG